MAVPAVMDLILCTLVFAGNPVHARDWDALPGSGTTLCMLEHEGRLYPYRIFFPSSYRHAPVEKGGDVTAFPLVVACHSAGSDEIAYFQWKGNADRIQTVAEQRGFIVACLAGPDRAWHERIEGPAPGVVAKPETPGIIDALVKEIVKQRHIDATRIYLMGASSGAIASFATAAAYPERFAAVAGVCGVFPAEAIDTLKQTPTLVFSAEKDRLIPIALMRQRARALEEAGGAVKFVETPRGHGGYRGIETYTLLFDWFEKHRRDTAKKE